MITPLIQPCPADHGLALTTYQSQVAICIVHTTGPTLKILLLTGPAHEIQIKVQLNKYGNATCGLPVHGRSAWLSAQHGATAPRTEVGSQTQHETSTHEDGAGRYQGKFSKSTGAQANKRPPLAGQSKVRPQAHGPDLCGLTPNPDIPKMHAHAILVCAEVQACCVPCCRHSASNGARRGCVQQWCD